MARSGIVSATAAVLTAAHAPLCVLVEIELPSGTLRFTSAGHAIAWDGETWLGAGELAKVEPIAEVASPQAAGINIQFSGIDADHVTAILDDHYQGNTARIWIATLDDGMEVEGDPVLVFTGRLDEPVVTIGRTAEIQLGIENRFADWDRPRLRMYTDADQKARHATDRFFENVAAMESTSINWGTYRGPVAPDPLKQFNRTLDKAAKYIPGARQLVIQPLRQVGDFVAKIFGF
jgi:hypothetical protein